MPRPATELPLLPSLLDRLFDDEPDVKSDPLWARTRTAREIREGVRRDLEMLLNTVQTQPELLTSNSELAESVLTYGLPDLTDRPLDDLVEQERLCALIRMVISRSEPRLRDVRVSVRPARNKLDRGIHLQIDAVLHVDPLIEQVTFDTLVDPTVGACVVKAPM